MTNWKKFFLTNFLLFSTVLIVSCTENTRATPTPNVAEDETSSPLTPVNLTRGNMPVSSAINSFAVDLYSQLKSNSENLFFSPYSISSVFSMVYAGARGNTQRQMADTFYFDRVANVHQAVSKLGENLVSDSSQDYQLQTANAMWGQKDLFYSIQFIDLIQENYGAGLKAVDFKNSGEQARTKINQWTASKTNNKIEQMLARGVLTQRTKLVLTNAIYFMGVWQSQFDEANTRYLPFQVSADAALDVPTMFQEGEFKYMENEEIQLAELPYKKSRSSYGISMIVILPKERDLSSLVESNLQMYLEQDVSERKPLALYLPKFKVESSFQLQEPLKKLGISDAFDYKQADFSGINGKKKDLAITAVIHKTFVDVSEKGTEAAAATSVVISSRGLRQNPIEFRVDRPFIFLIRDNQSKAVLFLGRVTNPSL